MRSATCGAVLTRPAVPRRLLLAAGLTCLAGSRVHADDTGLDDWHAFKLRYLAEDGRVIDNGSGGISHSEGQGWGLLFAVAFDDRQSFDRIHDWTEQTLRRPGDSLHAWRYVPSGRPPVADHNNATDGDIFIAAALARAGRKWSRPELLRGAGEIARDVAGKLTRTIGSRLLLLPGLEGFETPEAVVINPSYYAFPFMAELGKLTPSLPWDRLQRDGRRLIQQALFGKWHLPPDWLMVPRDGSQPSPASGRPPRFGYDAIRVPLWATWQKLPVGPVRRALDAYWSSFPGERFPAWVDLVNNDVAPYPATPGLQGVARLTQSVTSGKPGPELPRVDQSGSYYDAALILLCRLALQNLGAG